MTGLSDETVPPARFSERDRVRILAAHEPHTVAQAGELDAITDFAAALCETPTALISLFEERMQLFVGRTGFAASEALRDGALCLYTMSRDDAVIVPDTHHDARFCDAPAVTGDPYVRFYAGLPLVSDEGAPLGALCVVDPVPRAGLTPLQLQGLAVLRTAALDILRRQRSQHDSAIAQAAVQIDRDDQAARFHVLADTMPQMVWSTLPNGYHDYYNARWYEYTGVTPGSTDGEGWNDLFHPEDQDRAWALWHHSLAMGEPYEIEYRLRDAGGAYRWVLGRALPMRNAAGEIVRWFGTCTDIHEQKLTMVQRELISEELSHRIKNIFAVIGGLISLASREHPQFKPMADDLRARVMALGQAHDHVRPHSARSRPAGQPSTLFGLLDELLLPYRLPGVDRLRIDGDDVVIDDRSATPLALTFHELATNASKYGALSTSGGRLHIAVDAGPAQVEIRWTESDGPPLLVPDHGGFGTRLIDLSIERQLGGRIERHWNPGGFAMTMTIPAAAMMRSADRTA